MSSFYLEKFVRDLRSSYRDDLQVAVPVNGNMGRDRSPRFRLPISV